MGLFDEFLNFVPVFSYFRFRPLTFDNPGDTFRNRTN